MSPRGSSSAPPTSPKSQSQPLDPDILVDFLHSVPPIITRLLVELAPFLATLRWGIQIVSWRSGSPSESWLVLAVFWLVCLMLDLSVKYFLPVAVLAPYFASYLISFFRRPPVSEVIATEETLSRALSDVTIVCHLLPRPPSFHRSLQLPLMGWVRLFGLLYVPYLIIMYCIPLKVTVGVFGTILLTWRAPWSRTTRNIVAKNGWVRYISLRTWYWATSIAPSPSSLASTSTSVAEMSTLPPDVLSDAPTPMTLRFRFTIHENQRWWVGLDWTAALLPQERASWTSSSLRPIAPPMAISLPMPKTAYFPAPGKSKDLRMKRTATWDWEETDWGVVIRLSSASLPERIVMALPKVKDSTAGYPSSDDVSTSLPESLLQRGLQRVGSVSIGGPGYSMRSFRGGYSTKDGSEEKPHGEGDGESDDNAEGLEGTGDSVPGTIPQEDITDTEGWIYGDNKWERSSGKAGIGKFTRYRRWTRIAVMTETIEIVAAEEAPANESITLSSPPSLSAASPSALALKTPVQKSSAPPVMSPSVEPDGVTAEPNTRVSESPESQKGALRQRLRQAVAGQ